MSSANRCTNLSKEREIVMPRFFLEELDESDVCITGPDARHIGLSLRMRVGEMLTVCAYGRDYQCRIRSITPEEVHLDVVSSELCAAEPTVALTLYQAVPKADKLEQIIQKSVELGAVRIVPVLTRRCISRPKAAEFQKKLPRQGVASFPKLHLCSPLPRRVQRCSRQTGHCCCMKAAESGSARSI